MSTEISPISQTFARLRSQERMAFMPFITAGDPDLATTQKLIGTLAAQGVDLIEVGFPYSDPIADGPVIQASYTRALRKHLHVNEIFAAVREVVRGSSGGGATAETERRKVGEWGSGGVGERGSNLHFSPSIPPPSLVAMVAYAIIFRMGSDAFLRAASDAGFAGLIVPDLPADEAQELARLSGVHGLDLVQLIAPTTTEARTKRILETASGFLYCISVAGTTGVRDRLPDELKAQLRWLKGQTELPLAVGFGVSRPEQVDELRGLADGVIVGSAIVRHVAEISEQGVSVDSALGKVSQLAAQMVAATHPAS